MDGKAGLLLSLLLLSLAIAVFRASRCPRGAALLAGWCALALLVLSAGYVAADYFTGSGIDESVLFHLRYGLRGAGFAEYAGLIAGIAVFLALSGPLSYGIFRILLSRHGEGATLATILGLSFLLGGLGVHPASRDLFSLYALASQSAGLEEAGMPDSYAVPELRGAAAERNLLFIYLEGLERTYLDQAIFPGLTPNMLALERDARYFTEVGEAPGTQWTIAGMVASQCGIPLFTPSAGNSMSGLDEFLPGAYCMGDILAEAEFQLEFLGGAPLEFAGKGNFLRAHGFFSVQGRGKLLPQIEDPGYQSAWGLYDDSLFELARGRFAALAESGNAFGLFLLNLDTHHPDGHLSAYCENLRYRDGGNPILNAVHCTDRLVGEFVDEIRRGPHGEDTLIVLASDHLALNNSAWDMLEQGKRRNLFMVIDPADPQGGQNDRNATHLDIAPTVLSLLGLPVEGLGFGRNLLAEERTLAERGNHTDFLHQQYDFLAQLWQLPQLDHGMRIDPVQRVIHLGNRSVRFPTILVLGEDARVSSIKFEFSSPKKLIDYIDGKVPQDQAFVWVDTCAKVSALNLSPLEGEWCVAMGQLGGEELWTSAVDAELFLSRAQVRRPTAGVRLDEALYRRRLASVAAARGDYGEVSLGADASLGGEALLQSAGSPLMISSVKVHRAESGEYAEELVLTRGLSLIGFRTDGSAVKLAHRDTCDPDNPVFDEASFAGSFLDAIERGGDGFGAYAVVAHDSAVCSGYDMAPLFAGLELKEWQSLQRRQPYVALLAGNGEVREFTAAAESILAFKLSRFISENGLTVGKAAP